MALPFSSARIIDITDRFLCTAVTIGKTNNNEGVIHAKAPTHSRLREHRSLHRLGQFRRRSRGLLQRLDRLSRLPFWDWRVYLRICPVGV